MAISHVGLRRMSNEFRIGGTLDDAGRDSSCDGTGWNLGARGDNRSGCDNGPSPDNGVLENDRSRSHQGGGLDHTAFEMGEVTDRAVLANLGIPLGAAVDDRAVLDRGPCPDPDRPVVPAQDGRRPDGGLGPDVDSPNDDRVGMDECGRIDHREAIAEGIERHGGSSGLPRQEQLRAPKHDLARG